MPYILYKLTCTYLHIQNVHTNSYATNAIFWYLSSHCNCIRICCFSLNSGECRRGNISTCQLSQKVVISKRRRTRKLTFLPTYTYIYMHRSRLGYLPKLNTGRSTRWKLYARSCECVKAPQSSA